MSDHGLFSSYGQESWGFFKDAQGFGRLDAGSRAGSTSSRSPRPWTTVFSIFLISVRERMLKIHARSLRDDQVESGKKKKKKKIPTAGGIGHDNTVGISSPSTVATAGILRCKGVYHGEVIRCSRRVGARGGTCLYMPAVKQQQLERSQNRPGPQVTEAASETAAISTAITATFIVFKRMEACERKSTRRYADRSANDGDRVRHGFGSGDLRGGRQALAEGTQIGGRTVGHISSGYTTCCSPPSRQKCAIYLRKPSTTAWTRGSMS